MPSKIGKYIHRSVLLNHPFFHTSADKNLKWIPFATVFFLDIFGVKTRSGWKKQVLLAGATEAIRYFIADNLKKLTHEQRPSPYTGKHSFPSGHTSSSFAGAEFMHTEFKDSIPLLACTGYLGATATAAIRVIKGRHWIKDVIGGAVVGIVSARLAYLLVNKLAKRRIKKLDDHDAEASEETILSQPAER